MTLRYNFKLDWTTVFTAILNIAFFAIACVLFLFVMQLVCVLNILPLI